MAHETTKQNKLDPFEARRCITFDRIAAKVLADETVEKLPNLDSYNCAQALVTLFPRLRTEYKLLLSTIPMVREFCKE